MAARVALVVGGAEEVFAEVEAARALLGRPFDAVVACNDVGARIPDLTDWVTLHYDKMPHWVATRTKNGHSPDYQLWCHRSHKKFKCRTASDWGGSSGLFAVKVALLERGATHVICAGVPMTTSPHYHRKAAWRFADHHIKGWRNHLKEINARVRSMSGRTREMLGAPTAEWLATEIRPITKKEESKMTEFLCPRCGAPEIVREKRPGGNARCKRGHRYRVSESVVKPEEREVVTVAAADVGEMPAEILAEPPTSVPSVAQTPTVEGSAVDYLEITGKSVVFEVLEDFEYRRGEHLVAHYVPGLRYTCRTREHAALIDEWVAARRVRLVGAVVTGTSPGEVAGSGVVA